MARGGSGRRRRPVASAASPAVRRSDRSSGDSARDRRLLRAARRGDRGARDRLVVSRLGMIRAVAVRYRKLGLPFDDLVQEGSLGLLEAIDNYDPERSPDFDRYARFRVRRAVRNALTAQGRLIRLPKQIVERRRAIARAEAELLGATNGHPPTPAELAEATGLSVSAVLEARAAGLAPISLDEPLVRDGPTLAGLLADPAAADPEQETLAHDSSTRLSAALEALSERQQRIVSSHWGLAGPPRRIVELAEDLELSPRRTQAIADDALHELARQLHER